MKIGNGYFDGQIKIWQKIYSNLPRRLKHFEILIDDVKQINRIIERCENLSIIQWFSDNTTCHIIINLTFVVTVWLGIKEDSINRN